MSMPHKFLTRFLRVAQQVTDADRAMTVDTHMQVVDQLNLDDVAMNETGFREFADPLLRQALTDRQAVVTNNIITDPSQAPKTNASFANLRVVVVMPVRDQGAVYLDQPVSKGVIERDAIDRLSQMLNRLQGDELETITEEEMVARYNKLM